MKSRGIVMERTQSFYEIYKERIPLYEKYAEVTILYKEKNIEKIVKEIIFQINPTTKHINN